MAERLDIDPSRASRVVAATIDNGYLRRVASQRDGRRICLESTARGVEAGQNAHLSRQAFYKRLIADWSARDQQEFARLLTKFIDSLAEEDISR